MKIKSLLRASAPVIFAVSTVIAVPAFADEGHGPTAAGEAGKAANVTRTINVTMYDNYYEPEDISVKAGETVKFVITNKGTLVHEFNIGTAKMLMDHAPEMQMMVDHGILEADRINVEMAEKMQKEMGHGMHDAPNTVLLEPGKTGTVVWAFPKEAGVEFGCTVPGHYDAGMVGNFTLTN